VVVPVTGRRSIGRLDRLAGWMTIPKSAKSLVDDLALDTEWRSKTHAAVDAAAKEGGLAAPGE